MQTIITMLFKLSCLMLHAGPRSGGAPKVPPVPPVEVKGAKWEASDAQSALTSVIRGMESATARVKDYSAALVVKVCASLEALGAFLLMDSTTQAIIAGLGPNAETMLSHPRKHWSGAVSEAADALKREESAKGATEDAIEVKRQALQDASERLKSFDSAQASVSRYRNMIENYATALIVGETPKVREAYDPTDTADVLEREAGKMVKAAGDFGDWAEFLKMAANGLNKGHAATATARKFLAKMDAEAQAAKEEKEKHGEVK